MASSGGRLGRVLMAAAHQNSDRLFAAGFQQEGWRPLRAEASLMVFHERLLLFVASSTYDKIKAVGADKPLDALSLVINRVWNPWRIPPIGRINSCSPLMPTPSGVRA